MAKQKQINYYKSFNDEFVESQDQNYTLPDDYIYIRSGRREKLKSSVLYMAARIFARGYGCFALRASIVRSVNLKDFSDTGAVVYGNHTQPVGDVFMPAWVCRSKRCYAVASPANLGIPVIGRLLPSLGAIPVPNSLHNLKQLQNAVDTRLAEKSWIIVYPEAHVWPYYTKIRPFPDTSFSYAVKNHVPAFCMTSTYQERVRHSGRHRNGLNGQKPRGSSKRPKMTIYLDGPFFADESLPPKAAQSKLRDEIMDCMEKRSCQSTCEYIEYRPAADMDDLI